MILTEPLRRLEDVELVTNGLWRGKPANAASQRVHAAYTSAQACAVATRTVGGWPTVRRLTGYIVGRIDPSVPIVYRVLEQGAGAGTLMLRITAQQHGLPVWSGDAALEESMLRSAGPRLPLPNPSPCGAPIVLTQDGPEAAATELRRDEGAAWDAPSLVYALAAALSDVLRPDPVDDVAHRDSVVLSVSAWFEADAPTHALVMRTQSVAEAGGRHLQQAELWTPDGALVTTLRQESAAPSVACSPSQ